MPKNDYWVERNIKTQQKLTNKSIKETEAQLIKYYKKAQKRVINDFIYTYEKIYSTAAWGIEPTPADLYKLEKYWQLQGQLKNELQKLGDKSCEVLSKNFISQYQQIYKALAIKDTSFFGDISTETAQQMINQIWCADGKSWSDRVWKNTDKLQQALNDRLLDCVVTGKTPSYLKKTLMKEFEVSFTNADTIVRTEMAHIETQAARQRYQDYGIQEVEVLADEDERRCDVCGELHQKRFPIGGKMPVPAHPRCRCCIVPVVE